MEETKLMIGDWMDWPKSPFANPHFYSQVVTLERDGISPCIGIPLTPEILEKNGWWQDEIDGTYHNTMSVYGRKAPFSILDGVAINYVHELQHALRLCGLNELADNFKIE